MRVNVSYELPVFKCVLVTYKSIIIGCVQHSYNSLNILCNYVYIVTNEVINVVSILD